MKAFDSPVEELPLLSRHLGVSFLVKRDDLLPFPLAGNKVRKLRAELDSLSGHPDLVVTNGAVASNHCRTAAIMCAHRGLRAHLVLHDDLREQSDSVALRMLRDLGAEYTVVTPDGIAAAIADAVEACRAAGRTPHVVPGGCHTPAGANAYRDAAFDALRDVGPRWVVLASGTGATHGGVAAAAEALGGRAHVVGISIARTSDRGTAPVAEAAGWAGAPPEIRIDFRDSYVDGGYGLAGVRTREAMALGWRYGLPLDPTYTGKAFAGLVDMIESGELPRGDRVLFWHTGGLMNYLLEGGV